MKNSKTKKALYWLLDLGLNIIVILGLVIIIQTWIIAPFDVSGKSMCDTLNNINGECVNGYGEKIIINEVLYLFSEPKKGDIVVFKIPKENKSDEKYYIKRIIGEPGDTVKIENGEVYLKEKGKEEFIKLKENYLNGTNKGNTKTYFDGLNTYEVPENKYFVMGDNRNSSTDSRSCFASTINSECKNDISKSFIDREIIRGKASLVFWPITKIRLLDGHIYEELAN
ncbi:MAG: signal peptidase I [Candidatus Gracilibacteria bacterium]|jgi:signal peptidase I|nr:signal peptidase I [Candidatus Gracilibacteria bacterium]